jgi:hypothetical protein
VKKKQVPTRQPQRSDTIAGDEDKAGLTPIAAEKPELKANITYPVPAAPRLYESAAAEPALSI